MLSLTLKGSPGCPVFLLRVRRIYALRPHSQDILQKDRCPSFQTTDMDLMFMNSYSPNLDSSLPVPLFFTPPKGRRGSDLTGEFTTAIPDSIFLARRRALSMFLLQILAPSPKSVALARFTASVSSFTGTIGATGPKVSSFWTFVSFVTCDSITGE